MPKNTPSFPQRQESHHPSFPRRRESIRHSREGGNPQFPRTREFIVPLPQRPKNTPHSRKGGNPFHHPSFPRRRESTIPAHAGIHRPTSSKKYSVIPAKAGIHPIIRHFREGGNPQFPRTREFTVPLPQRPKKILRHSRKGRNPSSVIPAKTSVIPARKGRNPSHHPSFPRRRESTIPAHAGIHRPTTPTPKKYSVIPAKAGIHPIIRHSREGGNPQFPRTREFIVPPPQRPKNTSSFPQRQESIPSSVIPAKAGIHNSRARGNSSSHYPNRPKNTPSFPQRQESIPSSVIPAKAGIHNSRARGNSSSHHPNAQKILRPPHHSRKGRNPFHHPSFPRRRESTIPAHAGIHRPTTPTPKKYSVIPAKTGIHPIIRHSREGGNPQFPRTREFIVPLPQCPKNTPSLPRRDATGHDLIRGSLISKRRPLLR